jgi:hypothetical protein
MGRLKLSDKALREKLKTRYRKVTKKSDWLREIQGKMLIGQLENM